MPEADDNKTLFTTAELKPSDLPVLFPPLETFRLLNFSTKPQDYLKDQLRSRGLQDNLWTEDGEAYGETAFWLKIISEPTDASVRIRKVRFINQVYDQIRSSGIIENGLKADLPESTVNTTVDNSLPNEEQSEDCAVIAQLFSCSVCQFKGSSPKELQLHMEADHTTTTGRPAESLTASLLTCPLCSKAISNRNNLRMHMRRMHNYFTEHNCNYCHFIGVTEHDLHTHKRQKHPETIHTARTPNTPNTSLQCPLCHKVVASRNNLKNHLKGVHNYNTKHDCSLCPFIGVVESDLHEHMRKRHPELQSRNSSGWKAGLQTMPINHQKPSTLFKCRKCVFVTSRRGVFISHQRTYHPTNDVITTSITKLNQVASTTDHSPTSAQPSTPVFPGMNDSMCNTSSITTPISSPSLVVTASEDGNGVTGRGVMTASEDGNGVTGRGVIVQRLLLKELQAILTQTIEKREGKTYCRRCNYMSPFHANMRKHVVRVHTNIRPFKCPHCSFCGAESNDVHMHMARQHHDKASLGGGMVEARHDLNDSVDFESWTGSSDLQPSISPSTPLTKLQRESSRQILASPEVQAVYEQCIIKQESGYACSQCAYTNSHLVNIQRHSLRVHSAVRPFSCSQCDYRSATRQDLSLHITRNHPNNRNMEKLQNPELIPELTMKELELAFTQPPQASPTQVKMEPPSSVAFLGMLHSQ